MLRKEVNAGPAAARNTGFAAACELGATVICFLDDDCIADPSWTAAMEQAQAKQPGIVCGQTQAVNARAVVGECPAPAAMYASSFWTCCNLMTLSYTAWLRVIQANMTCGRRQVP